MATKMVMPLLGQTMEEGTIIKWFKKEGDQVKSGEPLLEVMTDKVNMEVEAPESGVLRKIFAQVDDIVPVKDPICIIASAAEPIDALLGDEPVAQAPAAAAAPAASAEEKTPAAVERAATAISGQETQGKVFASPAARRVAGEHNIDVSMLAGKGSGPNGRIVEKDIIDYLAAAPRTTPLAGKIAADAKVDLGAITGTGIGGKVTSEDIRKMAAQPAPPPTFQLPPAGTTTIPLAGMRKAIADNVAASARSAVHVTLTLEVDMTECVKLRKQLLPLVEKKHSLKLSFMDFITKAAGQALVEKPIVNSVLQDNQIVLLDQVNIGIATALESGLVVPVVKDVQNKSVLQISSEIKELVARARASKPLPDDFKGGTFTITNLGGYGIDSFTPIITPGQSAILAVCRIAEKPVVVDGEIVVRSMMNLCLSFDHRIMDGAPAAEFLKTVKDNLEAPYLLLV